MHAVTITYLGNEPSITPKETVAALLDEVENNRDGVGVLEVSDWQLEVSAGWLARVEHVQDTSIAPRYLQLSGRQQAQSLIEVMGIGDIDLVLTDDWQPKRS